MTARMSLSAAAGDTCFRDDVEKGRDSGGLLLCGERIAPAPPGNRRAASGQRAIDAGARLEDVGDGERDGDRDRGKAMVKRGS
jgi:hypothetical protein